MKEHKVIAVVGPTASGKSGLAIELAKEFNGEIINADSRQVYKYMNIGTAKDPDDNPNDNEYTVNGVVHHLIDFVEPNQNLSVAEFQELAYEKIKNITERGKVPFLVGGTGLWIDAVCKGYEFAESEQNWELRDELSKKTVDELFEYLKELKESKADELNESDRRNPRRLIRAIEVEMQHTEDKSVPQMNIDSIYLSIETNIKDLEQKMYSRVDKMFEQGLMDENKELLRKGYTYDMAPMSGIGYKEFEDYFQEEKTLEEVKEEIKLRTRQYAKRQMTWFKRNKDIHYVDLEKAGKLVSNFLKS